MQETQPEEFKQFIETGRLLEKIASEGKEGNEEVYLKTLSESPYQQMLTFSVYRSLKTAINKRNKEWI